MLAERDLNTLAAQYAAPLTQFACRLVGDRQVAEEICQDALLKAWQKAGDIPGRAWFYRVVRNATIDRHRQQKQRPEIVEYEDASGVESTTARPEREAERAWLHDEITAVLAALPPAYRQVVRLRYYHGYGYQDIADELGIPLGTMKSRLNYGLQRLARDLRRRGIDRPE